MAAVDAEEEHPAVTAAQDIDERLEEVLRLLPRDHAREVREAHRDRSHTGGYLVEVSLPRPVEGVAPAAIDQVGDAERVAAGADQVARLEAANVHLRAPHELLRACKEPMFPPKGALHGEKKT